MESVEKLKYNNEVMLYVTSKETLQKTGYVCEKKLINPLASHVLSVRDFSFAENGIEKSSHSSIKCFYKGFAVYIQKYEKKQNQETGQMKFETNLYDYDGRFLGRINSNIWINDYLIGALMKKRDQNEEYARRNEIKKNVKNACIIKKREL